MKKKVAKKIRQIEMSTNFHDFFSPFVIFRYFFLLNSYHKLVGSPGNRVKYFLFVFESNKEISFLKGLESDLSLKSVNSRRYILD